MKIRIAIYGGTHLNPVLISFLTGLTRHLLKFPEVVLVSGGFDHHIKAKKKLSVDKVVMTTAEKLLGYPAFNDRFETWLSQDNDRPGVVRFRKGTLMEIAGSTQSRRFNMVQHLDALITVAGMSNTRSVTELALAIDKPVLPIPFSRGESARLWKKYNTDIEKQLTIPDRLKTLLQKHPVTNGRSSGAGKEIASFIVNAVRKTCLVLMPFEKSSSRFYDGYLRPAIEAANYVDHRIDRNDPAGNIPELFKTGLQSSRAVIIDITGFNPNVMYELGQVHAMKITPLILLRTGKNQRSRVQDLPFYLRQEMIVKASDTPAGHAKLQLAVAAFLQLNGMHAASRPK